MRVDLGSLPSPPKEYIIEFPRLDGGLNTWELDYRLKPNESPEMKNLWWMNGTLCSRDGQVRLTSASLGTSYSAYEVLFWDHAFFHIGSKLYYVSLTASHIPAGSLTLVELIDGVPENRGTWFRYGNFLYYKNRGRYLQIDYDGDGSFTAIDVPAYSPIILVNANPDTAAGDTYQPENRLSAQKTVWYSTVEGVKVYHLPVKNVSSVDKVIVDGNETSAYSVDLAAGTVTFTTEPTHHNPVVANSVRITYTKENPDAYNSIMDCPYATTFGGSQSVCVVVGGSSAQPNAYFWSGNHVVMDPGYFPITQYNLAGAAAECITGFGKQQNMLVVFKERSVGRASVSTTEMEDGRVLLSMDYTPINDRIGCDMPGSIQLVQNNLVFANTKQGIHILKDSSAAYENNIEGISRKVDNTLLPLIQKATCVTSYDDGSRYWLVADGEVYAWDYFLSGYSDPSWFYFTNINAVDFIGSYSGGHFHLEPDGNLTMFTRSFSDYGEGIDKKYRFATQHMGSYDRVKNITGVQFSVRGDTDTEIEVEYICDYSKAKDPVPIQCFSYRFAPRNLSFRCLRPKPPFAYIARRRPGMWHVRHFTMLLSNNQSSMDMSVMSATIFYNFQGRDR